MRKEKKTYYILIYLVLIMTLLMVGCGSKEQPDPTKTGSAEATATPIPTAEPTPEATATPAPTATPKPIVLDAGFDEAFVAKPYKKFFVGRDDVSIIITEVYTYVNGDKAFWYILKAGKGQYDGEVRWNKEEGIEVNQDKFSMNRVLCEEVNFDENIFTLIITETTDIQEPLELSGNPEDIYITKRPEYIEREDVEIDMHNHTTGSDGNDSPLMLILRAHRLGLKTISITDHNSVGGYKRLQGKILKKLFLKFLL